MENFKKSNAIYSNFMFLKIDPQFRRMISNEKIAAKQEFENMIANYQEKLFLRTYLITGLRADCDILFWRISQDIEYLQEVCARTFSTGVGKFFTSTYSFLGVFHLPDMSDKKDIEFGYLPKDLFGRYKFVLVHPVIKSHLWYELSEEERHKLIEERNRVLSKYSDVQEHFFMSYGLDDQELIVVREAKYLEDLISSTKELKKQRVKNFTLHDRPILFCVGKDLRDILDTIG